MTSPKRPDRPTPQRIAPERDTPGPKATSAQTTREEDKPDSVRDDSACVDASHTESEEVDLGDVTDNPGVMHTGSQTVMRDGVQVLTDTPERSDDPLAGVRRTRD